MYWVYAIKSSREDRIYVGLSTDVNRRINEHNNKQVFSTKGYCPWKLIFKEFVSDRKEARMREKYYKSGIGKEYLKQIPL